MSVANRTDVSFENTRNVNSQFAAPQARVRQLTAPHETFSSLREKQNPSRFSRTFSQLIRKAGMRNSVYGCIMRHKGSSLPRTTHNLHNSAGFCSQKSNLVNEISSSTMRRINAVSFNSNCRSRLTRYNSFIPRRA